MNIAPIRLNAFWSSIRATPFMFFFHAATVALTYPSPRNLLYLAAYCCNFLANGVCKIGMQALYETLGVKQLPLLGIGMRPQGATNCGTFLKWNNMPAITYGMPSGHSQNAWFFATYMILEIWRYYNSSFKDGRYSSYSSADSIVSRHPAIAIILAVALSGFAGLVSYSRVWIEGCHTIQQVVVGAGLGIGLGAGLHYTVHIILNSLHYVTGGKYNTWLT